ncbi:MAG: biotin--[acetyl-CoA-carboxylase] ligase [Candidatus Bathyarchaeia archaeon]
MAEVLENIIKTLKEKKDDYTSGEELAKQLNISRVAVWKYIQKLKSEGYHIKSVPNKGYCLLGNSDLLLPWEIKAKLQTSLIGHEIHYFKEVNSTQDIAKRLASEGAREGTIVVAERQTNGRGRMGRDWFSPSGGVWLSIILRPRFNPRIQGLTLLAGVAVARAIKRLYNLEAKLKWPNDVILNGKKVCGILAEVNAEMDLINYLVIGIGVNVNVDLSSEKRLRETATSIKEVIGKESSRVDFLQILLEEFEHLYRLFAVEGFGSILNEWRGRSETLGALVSVTSVDEEFEGLALNVDGEGFLIVKLRDGSLKRVVAGDVRIMKA